MSYSIVHTDDGVARSSYLNVGIWHTERPVFRLRWAVYLRGGFIIATAATDLPESKRGDMRCDNYRVFYCSSHISQLHNTKAPVPRGYRVDCRDVAMSLCPEDLPEAGHGVGLTAAWQRHVRPGREVEHVASRPERHLGRSTGHRLCAGPGVFPHLIRGDTPLRRGRDRYHLVRWSPVVTATAAAASHRHRRQPYLNVGTGYPWPVQCRVAAALARK